MKFLLGLLGALVLTLSLMWLAPLHPLLEVLTNVRAQVMPLALIPLIGFLLMHRWQFAAAAFVVLAINAAYLVPYWTASPDPLPDSQDTITALQYNIFFGNNDYQAIADHISDSAADVVVLHELLPEQWAGLEPLLTDHPHHIAEPLPETDGQPGGGMAMLSRTPLDRQSTDEAMSPQERVTIVATTMIDGHEIMMIGLHPHASRTEGWKVDLRQAQLDGVADVVTNSSLPAIVLTDLNIAPTSPAYQGFLDDMGWRDPHRVVGWQSSWPTWGGSFGVPIDHILVSDEFALHSYETGDGAGSDHKSVVAVVSLAD